MAQSNKNKALSRKRQHQKAAAGRSLWPILLLAGLSLLLLGGGIWWGLERGSGAPANFTPQAETPRLAVDRESIDLGPQPVNRPVSAVFQVKNVGSQTLRIQGEPTVELVEGC